MKKKVIVVGLNAASLRALPQHPLHYATAIQTGVYVFQYPSHHALDAVGSLSLRREAVLTYR